MGDEFARQHRARISFFGFQHLFGDALKKSLIAVDAYGKKEASDGRAGSDPLQRMLRMLEAHQASFSQRIHAHNGAAAPRCRLQISEHAGMAGPGILPDNENKIGQLKIAQRYRAFADADDRRERGAAGFMTHVGAVGKVVGAELAHEKLVKKSGFVAGAAGGIKDGFIRRVQRSQLACDELECFIPGDGFIVIAAHRQMHGMSEAALLAQPVVGSAAEFRDAPPAEKFRSRLARGGFFSHRLGAVLAIFVGGAFSIRIRPGAARTIETIFLIQHSQRRDATTHAGLLQSDGKRFGDRRHSARRRCRRS